MKSAEDFFNTSDKNDDLKRKSVRGGASTMSAQIAKIALRMGSMMILARILTPEDFGIIGMVLAITNLAAMFKDAGLSQATQQKDQITHKQISNLFWINTGLGTFLSLFLMAISPVVAMFYGEPRLIGITIAISISFFFGGLTSQHQALLRRKMRFGLLAIIELTSTLFSIIIAVILSLIGFEYWALVSMHISVSFFAAVGCWIAAKWIPGLPSKKSDIRDMLSFGLNITGFSFVNYFSRNADNLLIGKFLGPIELGFYSRAYGLLMLPMSQIRVPLTSVGLPALSRLQSSPVEYRDYYRKLLVVFLFVTIPFVLGLCAFAPEIILLLLGPKWMAVVDVFAVLSLASLAQTISGTTGMVMMSTGNSRRLFILGIISSVFTVASFIIGLPFGIYGVSISYTIANYILLIPYLYFSFKDTPVKVTDVFSASVLPCIGGGVAIIISRMAFALTRLYIGVWLSLGIVTILYVFIYFIVLNMIPAGRALISTVRKTFAYLKR